MTAEDPARSPRDDGASARDARPAPARRASWRDRLGAWRLWGLAPERLKVLAARLGDETEFPRPAQIEERICDHANDEPGRWRRITMLLNDRRHVARRLAIGSRLRRAAARLQQLRRREGDDGIREFAERSLRELREGLGLYPVGDVADIEKRIARREARWSQLASDIDAVRRTRVWALDALHYVAARSGIEAASLAVPLLLVVGMVHAHFFYTALGTSVLSLWTWQDLLNEGLRAMVPLILAMLLFNTLVLLAHVRIPWAGGFRSPFGLLVRLGPLYMGSLFLGITLVLSSAAGYLEGDRVWHRYAAARDGCDDRAAPGTNGSVAEGGAAPRENCALATARLTNGAELCSVLLAGTTDRAAVLVTGSREDPGSACGKDTARSDAAGPSLVSLPSSPRGAGATDGSTTSTETSKTETPPTPGSEAALLCAIDDTKEAEAEAWLPRIQEELGAFGCIWLDLLRRAVPGLPRPDPVFPDRARSTMIVDRANVICLGSRSQCDATKPTPPVDEPRERLIVLPVASPGATRREDHFSFVARTALGCRIAPDATLRRSAYFATNDADMAHACGRRVPEGTGVIPAGTGHCPGGDAFAFDLSAVDPAEIEFRVLGLASNAGPSPDNRDLSKRRAQGAVDWLRDRGFRALGIELGEAAYPGGVGRKKRTAEPDDPENRKVVFVPCVRDVDETLASS